jgi:hypothetical protein
MNELPGSTPNRLPDEVPRPEDPQAILGAITLRGLENLQARVNQPWAGILARERRAHEASLRALWETPQQPEVAPTPETFDAREYLDDIRKTNIRNHFTSTDLERFRDERSRVSGIGSGFADTVLTDREKSRFDTSWDEHHFVVGNLQATLISPRVHGLKQYEARRNALIKDKLPIQQVQGKISSGFIVDRHKVTGDQLNTTLKAVRDIPYKTPQPDFFQLPRESQTAVVTHLLKEVAELTEITSALRLSKQLLVEGNAPLAYMSPRDFTVAVKNCRPADRPELCKLFFTDITQFMQQVTISKNLQHAAKSTLGQRLEPLDQPISETLAQAAETHTLSANEQEIQKLLADPDVNEAVLDLRPNDTVSLVSEGQEIAGSHMETIVDRHLELIGRAIHESLPNPSLEGVMLYDWTKANIGGLLRDKHLGRIVNLKITRLLATPEELQGQFKDYYDPEKITPDTVAKLIISAELKSSGKKPVPAAIQLLLSVRRMDRGRDRINKRRTGLRLKGQDAIDALHEDAAASAISRTVNEAKRITNRRTFPLR